MQLLQHRFGVFARGELVDADFELAVLGHHLGGIARRLQVGAQGVGLHAAGHQASHGAPLATLQHDALAGLHFGLADELGELVWGGLACRLFGLAREHHPERARLVQHDAGLGIAHDLDLAFEHAHGVVRGVGHAPEIGASNAHGSGGHLEVEVPLVAQGFAGVVGRIAEHARDQAQRR